MEGIGGGGHEPEKLIEGASVVILGMNDKGADAGNVSCLQGAAHGVLHETGAEPPALPVDAYRKTRQQHDRDRMAGKATGQALRRILVSDLANDERIEAHDRLVRKREIGLRCVRLLVWQGKADEKTVELLASAIEGIDRVIATELFNSQPGGHPGSGVSNTLRSWNSRRRRGTSRGGVSSAAMKAVH